MESGTGMEKSGNEQLLCGCKGIRTCLICESYGAQREKGEEAKGRREAAQREAAEREAEDGREVRLYRWCQECGQLRAEEEEANANCGAGCKPAEEHGLPAFAGVQVFPEFVTRDEEAAFLHTMDQWPWKPSQSGRFKQVRILTRTEREVEWESECMRERG